MIITETLPHIYDKVMTFLTWRTILSVERRYMKRYLYGISISLLTFGLVGVTALAALAVTQPFHMDSKNLISVNIQETHSKERMEK